MTETSPSELLSDEAVYRRTHAGQREVIFDHLRIAGPALRLLRMVNGYTPLRSLLDLQSDAGGAAPAILFLLESDLIEPVKQ